MSVEPVARKTNGGAGGRPTEFTPDTVEAVLAVVRQGVPWHTRIRHRWYHARMAEPTICACSTPNDFVPLAGYESTHLITSHGVVKSLKRRGTPERILGTKKRGGKPGDECYIAVALSAAGSGPNWQLVHRLVMKTFIGPVPEGQEVRHLDGNPENNCLSNLKYGTRSENIRDTIVHGNHRNFNKTHCSEGHPYNEKNTYRSAKFPNKRDCRECKKLNMRKYREQRARRMSGIKS